MGAVVIEFLGDVIFIFLAVIAIGLLMLAALFVVDAIRIGGRR